MTGSGPEAVPGAAPPVRAPRRVLGWLLLAGAVLVIGALVYQALWRARPIGSGPAGPAVSREAFTGTWTDRPVLLLGLGDSVTAGFGASPGHGYFDRLVANPPGEFAEMQGINLRAVLPNLTAKNLSVSGTISSEHLRDQVQPLPVADRKVLGLVVMTTGGNDIIHNYGRTPPREGAMYGATPDQARPWIDRFEQRLDRMVTLIRSRFPGGAHIFLADIYDPTDGVGDAPNAGLPAWEDGLEIIAAYNAVIARCAEKHDFVHLVPMRETFLGHGIHCRQFWRRHYDRRDPHYWYYENLEDPNDRGYDALRRIFLNEIARVLAPPPGRVGQLTLEGWAASHTLPNGPVKLQVVAGSPPAETGPPKRTRPHRGMTWAASGDTFSTFSVSRASPGAPKPPSSRSSTTRITQCIS